MQYKCRKTGDEGGSIYAARQDEGSIPYAARQGMKGM